MATRTATRSLKHWSTSDEALVFALGYDGAELSLSVQDVQSKPPKEAYVTLATNSQELDEVIAILEKAKEALAAAEAKFGLAAAEASEGEEEEEEGDEDEEDDEDEDDAEEDDEEDEEEEDDGEED